MVAKLIEAVPVVSGVGYWLLLQVELRVIDLIKKTHTENLEIIGLILSLQQ